MSDDNVTELPIRPKKQDGDATLELVSTYSGCQHPRYIVDEGLEQVECAVCEERLNPMKVLVQISRLELRTLERLNALREESKELVQKRKYKCGSCGSMNDISKPLSIRSRTK